MVFIVSQQAPGKKNSSPLVTLQSRKKQCKGDCFFGSSFHEVILSVYFFLSFQSSHVRESKSYMIYNLVFLVNIS